MKTEVVIIFDAVKSNNNKKLNRNGKYVFYPVPDAIRLEYKSKKLVIHKDSLRYNFGWVL